MNKKILYYGILILILLIIFIVLNLILNLNGAKISPSSACGTYYEDGSLHTNCICFGIRTKVNDDSHCWGIKFNIYIPSPEIKEIRKIENNMHIRVGKKIIVYIKKEDGCSKKAPGGCPIYIVPSEYFDISSTTSIPNSAKTCIKNYYDIATAKKEGNVELTLKYACSDNIYKKYNISIK